MRILTVGTATARQRARQAFGLVRKFALLDAERQDIPNFNVLVLCRGAQLLRYGFEVSRKRGRFRRRLDGTLQERHGHFDVPADGCFAARPVQLGHDLAHLLDHVLGGVNNDGAQVLVSPDLRVEDREQIHQTVE